MKTNPASASFPADDMQSLARPARMQQVLGKSLFGLFAVSIAGAAGVSMLPGSRPVSAPAASTGNEPVSASAAASDSEPPLAENARLRELISEAPEAAGQFLGMSAVPSLDELEPEPPVAEVADEVKLPRSYAATRQSALIPNSSDYVSRSAVSVMKKSPIVIDGRMPMPRAAAAAARPLADKASAVAERGRGDAVAGDSGDPIATNTESIGMLSAIDKRSDRTIAHAADRLAGGLVDRVTNRASSTIADRIADRIASLAINQPAAHQPNDIGSHTVAAAIDKPADALGNGEAKVARASAATEMAADRSVVSASIEPSIESAISTLIDRETDLAIANSIAAIASRGRAVSNSAVPTPMISGPATAAAAPVATAPVAIAPVATAPVATAPNDAMPSAVLPTAAAAHRPRTSALGVSTHRHDASPAAIRPPVEATSAMSPAAASNSALPDRPDVVAVPGRTTTATGKGQPAAAGEPMSQPVARQVAVESRSATPDAGIPWSAQDAAILKEFFDPVQVRPSVDTTAGTVAQPTIQSTAESGQSSAQTVVQSTPQSVMQARTETTAETTAQSMIERVADPVANPVGDSAPDSMPPTTSIAIAVGPDAGLPSNQPIMAGVDDGQAIDPTAIIVQHRGDSEAPTLSLRLQGEPAYASAIGPAPQSASGTNAAENGHGDELVVVVAHGMPPSFDSVVAAEQASLSASMVQRGDVDDASEPRFGGYTDFALMDIDDPDDTTYAGTMNADDGDSGFALAKVPELPLWAVMDIGSNHLMR